MPIRHRALRTPGANTLEQRTLRAFCAQFPTQREAAQQLGITSSHLSDLLRDRRTFSVRVLDVLGLRRTVVRRASPSSSH